MSVESKNDAIMQFTHCSENIITIDFFARTEKEPSIVKKGPEKITELFEKALRDAEWLQANRDVFNQITNVIGKPTREYSYSSTQLERITRICEETLLTTEDSSLINPLLDVRKRTLAHLSGDNLFMHPLAMNMGLEFYSYDNVTRWQNDRGLTITQSDNGTLKLELHKKNEMTDFIFETLNSMSEEKRKKIDFHLNPRLDLSEESLMEFFKDYGSQADSLILKGQVKSNQHLEVLLQNCPNIRYLKIKNEIIKDFRCLSNLKNLKMLDCRLCENLQIIPEIESLTELDCSGCVSLYNLPEFKNLTTLKCGGCNFSILPALKNLTTLESTDNEFSEKSRFNFLLNIYFEGNRDQLSDFCKILNVKKKYFIAVIDGYFNTEETLTLTHAKASSSTAVAPAAQDSAETSSENKNEIPLSQLRLTAFKKFPFLFEELLDDALPWGYQSTLPSALQKEPELKKAIDAGAAEKELKARYGIGLKTLQKIPFSTNHSLDSKYIIKMIQNKTLRPEWLPKTPGEEKAFCDVIGACLFLSKVLRFNSYDPDRYDSFVTELIKSTARDSYKNWQLAASQLPSELQDGRENASNIRDAIDDFVKTVFLPYHIQHSPEDLSGKAKEVYEKIRKEATHSFLKGAPLNAILQLSSHWHAIGTMAQLNKAKTFSNYSWPSLLSEEVHYPLEEGSMSAVSLTTSLELTTEGEKLKHCVGGYTHQCLQENSHIVSLRDEEGKSLSTLEFELLEGTGDQDDKDIVNIEGENGYHLKLIQHYGKNNTTPPKICQDIAVRLIDDMRNGTVKVNLSELNEKREERIRFMEEHKDITLVGYDPKDPESFEKARGIYREWGIKRQSHYKTLLGNFDTLTGKASEQQIAASSSSS